MQYKSNFHKIKYAKIISHNIQSESITRIQIQYIFDNDNQFIKWKIYQKINKM